MEEDPLKPLTGVLIFVGLSCASALFLALCLDDYRLSVWAPSLACNLLTTGLAILAINVVVAGQEERRRTRQKDEERQLHDRLVTMKTFYPAALCLGAASETARVAKGGGPTEVARFVKTKETSYLQRVEWLKELCLVFGRFMGAV